jgi:hypothetical protein
MGSAEPAPEVAEKGSRIAISAFKTTAAHSPAEVVSPSIPRGRILPSLVEISPGTGQAEAARTELQGGGSAAKAGIATQVPGDGTVVRRPGGHIYSPEDREPAVAVGATAPRFESPTPSDPNPSDARPLRSVKRIRRPAEKHARFDPASSTSADMSETASMVSTSSLAPVGKPSSTARTSRILDRYVFRHETGPGELWKRRIEARRERRA